MSDLNQLIDEWRNEFRSNEAMRAEDIAELEEHLRDSCDRLAGTELTAQEAFLVARVRLGSPDVLGPEFGKTNNAVIWQRRVVWMLVGYLGLSVCRSIISSVSNIGSVAAFFGGANAITQGVISALVSIGLWGGLMYVMSRSTRNGGNWFANTFNKISRPLLVLMLSAVVLSGYAVSLLMMILLTRSATSVQIGEIYAAQSVVAMTIQLPMLAICIFAIVTLRRRGRTIIV